MVHRQGAARHARLHTAADGELVGVDLAPQATAGSRREDAGGIFGREESFIAENIHEISEFCSLRHHPDHLVYIGFAGSSAAHGVRPQEGGAHQRGHRFADAADHPEHLQFIRRIEAVAALDLEGSGPLLQHLPDPLHRLLVERIFPGAVQQVGGVEDAPAPGGDFFIGQARDLVEEFPRAAAGIDDVGMAVAERGHQHPTLRIQHPALLRDGRHRTEIHDPAVLHAQPGVVEDASLRHLHALLAQHALRHDADQFAYVGNYHISLIYCSFRRNSTDFSMSGCI